MGHGNGWMDAMSFMPEDERGPKPDDRIRLVEFWCETVGWLCQQYSTEYADGDLRTRWAIYHVMGLIADTAKGLGDEARTRMIGVNWRALSGLRTFLVHRPWDVDPGIVWESATEDIPFLLSELRRHQTQQAG